MKTNAQILLDVKIELTRFQKKLSKAILEQSNEKNSSHKQYASCKRGALDLKNELTKLTQDSKYKWEVD